MTVTPLAVLIRQVITRAQGEFVKNSAFLTPAMLMEWLSEAYVDLNRALRLHTAQESYSASAGQMTFTRPSTLLDRCTLPDAVTIVEAGGAYSRIPERDWPFVRQKFGDLSNPAAARGPECWAWDQRNPESFLVLWPHASAVTVLMDFVRDPGPLERLYDPDTATAAVTNGSAVVTFAASVEGLVEVDDVFGVKADDESLPSAWYRVLSIDSTTQITLSSVYAGATNAAALFTLSQVSPMEWARPGLIRYAPVHFALARYWQMEEGDEASVPYFGRWGAEVERINIEAAQRSSLKFQGSNAVQRHPALRRFR